MIVAVAELEPNKRRARLTCTCSVKGETVLDGEAWAWGFWEGMELRKKEWDPIWHSKLADLLRPIYLLGSDELEEEELALVDSPLKTHKLTVEMESAIPHIYQYWLPHRKSAVVQVKHETPKLGRNDDCSCGSGKKYKKCCGAENAALPK